MRKVAILLLAALAAGCGGSSSSSSETEGAAAGGAPIRTITIDETEFELEPATVSVSKPGTYVFRGVNKGSVAHAIAVEGNGVDEDGPTVQPGGVSVLKVTLAKAGSYELYCPVDGHEDQGMTGTLTVGGASGPVGEGTTTDDESTDDKGSGY